MNDELITIIQRIVAIASRVPDQSLLNICDRLEVLSPDASMGERLSIARDVTPAKNREDITKLLKIWNDEAHETSPSTISWAIRVACEMDKYHRSQQSVELVWTGPSPPASSLRRTDQVLLDLIQSAEHSLIIVTFAAYKIPNVSKELVKAGERDVDITLILESSEESDGKLTIGALENLGNTLAKSCKVYVWPLDKRPKNEYGRHGSLHVKCAIADDNSALVSSANLTEYALNLNMELGILIRGGNIPRHITEHLRHLIDRRVLKIISL